MADRRPSQQQQSDLPSAISENTLQQILKIEEQRIQLHMQRAQSRDKEIDANARIAEKTIEAQAAFLKTKPSEDRKTMGLIIGAAIFVVIMFSVFICYLLNSGNKEFAHSILLGLSHLAVGVGAYFAGNKNKSSGINAIDMQDSEVVE